MSDRSFDLWWRLLLFVSVALLGVGLLIALAPGSRLLAPHTAALAERFFEGQIPAEAERLRRFLFAPLGATIAGYFLLQTFVVAFPFRRRERWAWHAVLWALLLWFGADSALSVHHGAAFNVWMVNLWTLALVGLPLAATFRAFHRPKAPGDR